MTEFVDHDLILVERIASGGMADLYLGIQTGLGGFEKTVAVKKIAPRFSEDRSFQSELQSEAAISSRLQHRNIAQVFRCTEHEGCLALVMELIEGKTLHDIQRRILEQGGARIPIPIALTIISEVARGLAYAHSLIDDRTGESLEIVHRDVSPQNVMISYSGEVKLLDFGIAKAVNTLDATKTGTLKGKVRYMSPEQVEGAALDGRSDLFSLGIVLQELLTLQPMFVGSSVFEIARKICTDPLPSLVIPEGALPDAAAMSELARIVSMLLARDRQLRYQTGVKVADDLDGFLRTHFPQFTSSALVAFMQELFGADRAKEREHRREALGRSGAHYAESASGRRATSSSTASRVRAGAPPAAPESGGAAAGNNRARVRRLVPAIVIALVLLAAFLRPRDAARSEGMIGGDETLLVLDAEKLELDIGSPAPEWRSLATPGGRSIVCRQSRGEYQPKLALAEDGVHRLLSFDGLNDYLDCDETASALHTHGQLTVIAVAAPRLDKSQYLWSMFDSRKIVDIARGGFGPGGAVRFGEARGEYHDTALSDPFRVAVYSIVISSRKGQIYRNSERVADFPLKHPFVLGDVDRIAVGMDWDGADVTSDHFGGQIGYLAMIGRAMEPHELEEIERALMTRFGLLANP